MKIKYLIVVSIQVISWLFSQTHFTSAWSGVPYQPFAVYIGSGTIDGVTLQAGDEIAIFDDDICVGVTMLVDELISTVTILASADNPDTPDVIDGFTSGNPVIFRIWETEFEIEYTNFNVELAGGSDTYSQYGFCEVDFAVESQEGCPDIRAINYNPDATIDDGSCLFTGCTDPMALNYDLNANLDDGFCQYPVMGDVDNDGVRNVLDVVLVVDIVLNPENYGIFLWMDLNEDAYLNILDIVMLVEWILAPDIVGCTNLCAENYNPNVLYDDHSCITLIDIDGNNYETVCIGEQSWMAQNLNVTHYGNGDPISTGYSDSQWANLSTGAYSVYHPNPTPGYQYGHLYNWYAVNDNRGICPEGWHVPSDEEWMDLELFLGMSWEEVIETGWRGTNEGSQLSGIAELWLDGSLENNEEFSTSGFQSLPTGSRDFNTGSYVGMGEWKRYWTSTAYTNNRSKFRGIIFSDTRIDRGHPNRRFGFSVRCVKD